MASLVFDYSVDQKSAVKTWTFKDAIPTLPSDTSLRDVKVNYDFDAIEGAIFNMFLFTQGERILRPDFGNSLYQFLYEPITPLTADRIAKEVKNMFQKWEPRVSIIGVQVVPDEDHNTYNVIVAYTVPALENKMPKGGLQFQFTANARRIANGA